MVPVEADAEKRDLLRAPYPDKLPSLCSHDYFRPLHGDGWGYLALGSPGHLRTQKQAGMAILWQSVTRASVRFVLMASLGQMRCSDSPDTLLLSSGVK